MSQIYYADSSVLVKRHIQEIGSDWLLELIESSASNSIITSTLSITEVLSSLNRLTCSPKITPMGRQESIKMRKGDFCDEKGTYGRADSRDNAGV